MKKVKVNIDEEVEGLDLWRKERSTKAVTINIDEDGGKLVKRRI